ncbi:hypothetical protein OF897_20500, partial [Chryseobacterium formosus]
AAAKPPPEPRKRAQTCRSIGARVLVSIRIFVISRKNSGRFSKPGLIIEFNHKNHTLSMFYFNIS